MTDHYSAAEKSSLRMGINTALMGSDLLQPIQDSSADEPIEVLRQRLQDDGYLCLRNLVPRPAILAARQVMLGQLRADGALSADSTGEKPRGSARSYLGKKVVTHHPDFLATVEHPVLFQFFDRLFGEPSRTFDFKWGRVVEPMSAGTKAHIDTVYMGRGSERLHTCWMPLGDIPLVNGPMVVLPESHRHAQLEAIQSTYGKMDIDRDLIAEGSFTDNYAELSDLSGQAWVSGDFSAGDVVIMGTRLFHGSITNTSDYLRLTVDLRFQPSADPIDERWVGADPIGHQAKNARDASAEETIAAARRRWGV